MQHIKQLATHVMVSNKLLNATTHAGRSCLQLIKRTEYLKDTEDLNGPARFKNYEFSIFQWQDQSSSPGWKLKQCRQTANRTVLTFGLKTMADFVVESLTSYKHNILTLMVNYEVSFTSLCWESLWLYNDVSAWRNLPRNFNGNFFKKSFGKSTKMA